MGSLDFKGVAKKVSNLRSFKKKALAAADEKFIRQKQKLIKEFDNHAVTKELKSGATSPNISRTLPGGYGNLFSFIGFNEGTDPTDIVRDALGNTKMDRRGKKQTTNNKITYRYFIDYPTLQELKQVTNMPWEAGLSWLDRIEKGISGFGYYMNTAKRRFSRSGRGVQVDRKIRDGRYSPVSYYSAIINNFKRGIVRGRWKHK